MPDRESLAELLGHQRLTITHPDDLTSFHPLDLGRMGISDLAASHDGDLKHSVRYPRRPRNTVAYPPQSALLASSPAWFSVSHCYSESSSIRRAIVSG